jgi:putative transcriptional regulator
MSKDDDFDLVLFELSEALAASEEETVSQRGLKLSDRIDVAAIRQRTGLSQPAFALRIGVPVATLRNWEQGHRHPTGPARVLLALLERNPRIVEEMLGG